MKLIKSKVKADYNFTYAIVQYSFLYVCYFIMAMFKDREQLMSLSLVIGVFFIFFFLYRESSRIIEVSIFIDNEIHIKKKRFFIPRMICIKNPTIQIGKKARRFGTTNMITISSNRKKFKIIEYSGGWDEKCFKILSENLSPLAQAST